MKCWEQQQKPSSYSSKTYELHLAAEYKLGLYCKLHMHWLQSTSYSWSQIKVPVIPQFSLYSIITELLPYKLYSVLLKQKITGFSPVMFFWLLPSFYGRKTLSPW